MWMSQDQSYVNKSRPVKIEESRPAKTMEMFDYNILHI